MTLATAGSYKTVDCCEDLDKEPSNLRFEDLISIFPIFHPSSRDYNTGITRVLSAAKNVGVNANVKRLYCNLPNC